MSPGEAMTLARRRLGLPQKAIADIWGVSTAYVSAVETGDKRFPRERVANLPIEIRREIVTALIADHERAIAELRELVAEGGLEPVQLEAGD